VGIVKEKEKYQPSGADHKYKNNAPYAKAQEK